MASMRFCDKLSVCNDLNKTFLFPEHKFNMNQNITHRHTKWHNDQPLFVIIYSLAGD